MPDMTLAAGILFLTPAKQALFIRRGATAPDFPGYWYFPGGHYEEDDKDLVATAIREAQEETGFKAKKDGLKLHTRSTKIILPGTPQPADVVPAGAAVALPSVAPAAAPSVDFSTYLARVPDQFTPKLCDESDAYCWTDVANPPQPLHPGCQVALDRLTMDELGVAEAIADGRLTSPQVYENVTLWAIRITGTGAAYRSSLGEFVWRDPAIYMNERFLRRCAGLSVIMKHPKGATLDSKEFGDRIIGSVFIPYLKQDTQEVWAIAKVYDEYANTHMQDWDLSTSPAVVFKDMGPEHKKLKLEDGDSILIEGDPKLLDHIAICEAGVWDKLGEPSGIINDTAKELVMADEHEDKKKDSEKTEERDDADEGVTLKKVLAACDAIATRMDSMEEERKADRARRDEDKDEKRGDSKKDEAKADKRKDEGEIGEKDDPEKVVADKRKDGDEDKDDKDDKRDDSKKDEGMESMADSISELRASNATLQRQLRDLAITMPKHLNDADYHSLAEAQATVAPIFQAFGDSEPRPMNGESRDAYERRMAGLLKKHSKKWAKISITAIPDGEAFNVIRDEVYADALQTAHTPAAVPVGALQEIINIDETGRRIKTFAGEPRAWMNDFAGGRKLVNGWKTETRH